MLKILVTGGNGALARSLVKELCDAHNVLNYTKEQLNVESRSQVLEVVSSVCPDIVIHTAALTNVEGCEDHVNATYNVNGFGTVNIATACKMTNSTLIYISTDYVFDGLKREGYQENDVPNPISIYGKSKAIGEWAVKSICDKYYIIRSSWLYGDDGSSFVSKIIEKSKLQSTITVVNDQIGSPTYIKDLSLAIGQLMDKSDFGTYHITNSGYCTWYDFAKSIFEHLSINDIELIPISSTEYPLKAKRPAWSILLNQKWELMGYPELRHYSLALKEHLSKMYI